MADKTDKKEYDWTGVNGQAANRLRAPRIPDVPAPIVKLAQKSWDGEEIEVDDEKVVTHVLRYDFGKGNEEMAAEFAKQMRNAGHHTTPLTSVQAAIDPDGDGSKHIVAWQAGQRRGRRSTN
jgi:hypothetical protein